jgi:hypothetical protein
VPRAKKSSTAGTGVSAADMAEFRAALAGTLSQVAVSAFPPADWASLTIACLRQGYTLVVSPQLDGRAVRLSVPVGTDRLAITASTDQELLEAIRKMELLVRKLPLK